jgi:hypothetical protein
MRLMRHPGMTRFERREVCLLRFSGLLLEPPSRCVAVCAKVLDTNLSANELNHARPHPEWLGHVVASGIGDHRSIVSRLWV